MVAEIAREGKATEIVVMDVRNLSTVTDYFVVVTGMSQNHITALGSRIEDHLETLGMKPWRVDGRKSTNWVVYDLGNVIVHAMLEETRNFYDLERLWGDAPKVTL